MATGVEQFIYVPAYGLNRTPELIEGVKLITDGDRVVLDLERLTFVRPSLLVMVRAYADLLARGDDRVGIPPGREVRARLPRSKQVRKYLETMQLVPGAERTAEEASRRYLPLDQLEPSSDTEAPAQRLESIVLQQLPPNRPDRLAISRALTTTFAELFENFARHAESGRPAWVCAQYYREHRYIDDARGRLRDPAIELAVVDTGIGIERSLAAIPEYLGRIQAGENACTLASQLSVTSKPWAHSGYGLFVARRLCERNGGVFLLISGRHWHHFSRRGTVTGELRAFWPGTFVGLRLSLKGEIDVNRVYSEDMPPHPALDP